MNDKEDIYKDIEEFLFRVKDTIPSTKPKEKTFLNVIKKEHHENSWSNLYAFFFDIEGSHGLGTLFIDSLLELISLKRKNIAFENKITIKREDSTKDKKRLDLALFSNDCAVLIENKVYHILNNDLQKYWDHYKQKNKVGIILSLFRVSIKKEDQENWINITHKDFMDKVMENFRKLNMDTSKYLVLLEDFYINICNVTNEMDTQKIQFCFNNIEEVEKIAQLRNQIKNAIKEAIKRVAEPIKLKPDEKESASCIYYKTTEKQLMYTVLYDKLFTKEKSIKIMIELNGNLIQKYKENEDVIPFTTEERELIDRTKYFKFEKNNWVHIAVIEYNLSNDDICNISDFINNKIVKESCLSSIFKKIKALNN